MTQGDVNNIQSDCRHAHRWDRECPFTRIRLRSTTAPSKGTLGRNTSCRSHGNLHAGCGTNFLTNKICNVETVDESIVKCT